MAQPTYIKNESGEKVAVVLLMPDYKRLLASAKDKKTVDPKQKNKERTKNKIKAKLQEALDYAKAAEEGKVPNLYFRDALNEI